MDKDAIYYLLSHIIRTEYEDIPDAVKEVTKKCFLDTIGALIAGSTAAGCQEVVDLVKSWGGVKECTIAVYGERVPGPNALWANSTMARSREVDTSAIPGEHPDVSAVPAVLATSEVVGRISGKDAITALILAIDFNLRLRLATGRIVGDTPWTAGTYAPFISTVAAGKLMRLTESQFLDALGLAFAQLSNTIQCHREGTLAVRVQNGLGAKNGFIAALLAQKGITGPHDILEGRFGYYPIFEQNRYRREVLLSELGEKYYNMEIMIKPYSCCTANFLPIEATLQLVRENDLHSSDIGRIVVYVDQGSYDFLAVPVESKRVPDNPAAAQFSIYYTVACAVVHRDVYLPHFTAESIQDPEVLEIASKVTALVDTSLKTTNTLPFAVVEIQTKEGKTFSRKAEYFKGHPRNPMTFDECVTKFKKNLTWSAKPFSTPKIEAIVDMIHQLEEVKDVAEIVQLMVP
jgi:2-methylcitrate dehydratase PrpD